ncbi:MAG: sugar transferase [Rhodobacteraceae bacterium]|nr:sugar transferase [Paracoccaceae bacterium]
MTLHYRALSDPTGVELGPLPATGDLPVWNQPLAVAHRGGSVGRPTLVPPQALPRLTGRYARHIKRVLDVVLSVVAIVLAAPVMAILALALWVEGGNPFYSQERLGMNGRRFRMWKLRTMVQGADTKLADYLDRDPALRAEWELTQKLKNDPRITAVGRMLRKTSMDELPQVFNVLKGDMSIVGPRPMLPEQMPLYRNPQAYLGIRPGLTGLWQVTARNENSFDLRAILDLRYAQRLSLWVDLKIIGSTFGVVWRATGY